MGFRQLHPVPPTPALVVHATACDVSSAHHLLEVKIAFIIARKEIM